MAMGMGYYNQQTAVANSINTDTVMRWNQYVYESQMNANRLHHGKLALERYNNIKDVEKVRKRLRDNPEQADIYRGDALNVALDEINDPRVYAKALEGAKVKVGGETIRNIPFQSASAAITMSIHQITRGKPPALLMTARVRSPTARPSRRWARRSASRSRTTRIPIPRRSRSCSPRSTPPRSRPTRSSPGTPATGMRPIGTSRPFTASSPCSRRPRSTSSSPAPRSAPTRRSGELLNFMRAFNLRFGAASTPQQRMTYDSLYPKLVDCATRSPRPWRPPRRHRPPAQEAGEFFSGMNYEDLKKKAPQPQAANAPAPPAPNAPQ